MDLRLNGPGVRLHLLSFAVWQRALASGHVQPVEPPHWDALSARAFLRQHFQGPGEMHLLRAALADDIGNQSRMSDDAILGAGSQRLCIGAWRIASEPREAIVTRNMPARANAAGTAEPVAEAAVMAPAPAAPAATPAAAPVTLPSPAPAPEWPAQTDQAAFAAVLKEAAQSATPFCEICARAAREKPPAPVAEWPEQTDQAAFAGVLQQAARNATPFCEICAHAARKQRSLETA